MATDSASKMADNIYDAIQYEVKSYVSTYVQNYLKSIQINSSQVAPGAIIGPKIPDDSIYTKKLNQTDFESAVDTLTADIQSALTTAESDIDSAEGRLDTLESDVTSAESRLDDVESDIDLRNQQTYTTVTQLGLTAGVPTINEAFTAMPNDSKLVAVAGDFASGQTPSTYGTVVIQKTSHSARCFCEFKGKEAGDHRYLQYTVGSGGAFTGTWVMDYTAADVTQILSDAGLSISSTSTPATSSASEFGTLLIFDLYKCGNVVTFDARYSGMTLSIGSNTENAIIPTGYIANLGYVALAAYCTDSSANVQAYTNNSGNIVVRTNTAITNILISGSWVTS